MRKITGLTLALALIVFPASSMAGVLWDTGAPNSTSFNSADGRAGMIDLTIETTLTGFQHYVRALAGGTVEFRLYADASGLPGLLLNSATATFRTTGINSDWQGIEGLNWTVAAGRYWIAIEERGTASIQRMLGLDAASLPANPLMAEALRSNLNDPYLIAGARTGWRIFGDQRNAVPEPATLSLLAVSLLGFGLSRRRRGGSSRAMSARA